MSMPPEKTFKDSHRMVNPDLAGGALLDLGIYSLTHVFQALYNVAKDPKPPTVVSQMRKYKLGTDQQTTMLLTFPRPDSEGGDAQAIATTGMRVASDPDKKGTAGPAIRIQGEHGELQLWAPIYRPTKSRLVLADGTVEDKDWPQPGPGKGSGFYNGFGAMNEEGEGHGMFWEADECAKQIQKGEKESSLQPLSESVVIMKVMDEVRRQNAMEYPEKIETTEYPVQL